MAIVNTFTHLNALVVDDMAAQQSTLRGQLAMLGISKVDVATNADDAIRLIRSRRYGLILCDYNLNHKSDGQQLLEVLRDNALLPADCLFFMVTAESGYTSVVAATEHVPDAYLLKPITASDVEDRMKALLEKRRVLLSIHERLDKEDLAGALAECDKLIAARNRWLMQALQLKGQTLLHFGRHQEAKQVYRSALEVRPELAWAQLGLARAHKAAGDFGDALRLAGDIVATREGRMNVAAYDVMAEALEAQGDLRGALDVLRDSAQVVPSARRQRLLGQSAYRNGDLETARDCLQKVAKATKGSVVAQPQDVLTLAQTLVDLKDPAGALKLLNESGTAYRNNPALESVSLAIQVQAHVQAGDGEGVARALDRARQTAGKGKADFGTVALAKAEITAGDSAAGFKLLEAALRADHESPVMQQLIGKTLRDTGHGDKIQGILDAATASLEGKVKDAKKLLRDGRTDEAIEAIEAAALEFPDNTAVLLQAAQINCMSLRLNKTLDAAVVERVRRYLSQLGKLLPANDRVRHMNRYFRETLDVLERAPALAN